MLTPEFRPLTAEERAALLAGTMHHREGCLDWSLSHFLFLVGFPVFGMLLTGLVLVAVEYVHRMPQPVIWTCLLIGLAGGFVYGVKTLRSDWAIEFESREACRHDLADGRAEVFHCSVTGAVQTEGDEDVGPDYFLQVGEGQVLFLRGEHLQDFEEDEEEGKPQVFPNQKIDVVKAVRSGTVLDVVCLGEPLSVAQVRMWDEWPEGAYMPADGEFLPASLETLADELKRLGAKHNAN